MNLVIAAERQIRFGLDRRRSTQGNEGNLVESISGCSRNGTWHVKLARALELDKIAKLLARSRRGKRHFTRLYERKTIRSLVLRFAKVTLTLISRSWVQIQVNSFMFLFNENPNTI